MDRKCITNILDWPPAKRHIYINPLSSVSAKRDFPNFSPYTFSQILWFLKHFQNMAMVEWQWFGQIPGQVYLSSASDNVGDLWVDRTPHAAVVWTTFSNFYNNFSCPSRAEEYYLYTNGVFRNGLTSIIGLNIAGVAFSPFRRWKETERKYNPTLFSTTIRIDCVYLYWYANNNQNALDVLLSTVKYLNGPEGRDNVFFYHKTSRKKLLNPLLSHSYKVVCIKYYMGI